MAAEQWRNWSGAITAHPAHRAVPEDRAALRHVVLDWPGPLRVAGAGHSFTPLCATDGTLIQLDRFEGIRRHDPVHDRVTVGAGTRIHALGGPLHERGLALINQGDIDRQALAGAVSTGTHGTGLTLGGFPSVVTAIDLMTADGTVISCDRDTDPDIFEAARLSLGVLGVLTDLTLQCRSVYKLRERMWLMPAQECMAQLPHLARATRHFEFLWFPYASDVICKSLDESTDAAPPPRGATGAVAEPDALESGDQTGRMLMEMGRAMPFFTPAVNRVITRMIGVESAKAPSRVRWSHEAFPSPRGLRFNEMEYAIPVDQGADCLEALISEIRRKRINVCFPIEYRFVAADDVWLSPFYGRDSVTISVHQYWKQSPKALFDLAEGVFRSFGGRPHWGKMHTLDGKALTDLYPQFEKFNTVRAALDPKGRFLNDHLRGIFEG